MADISGKQGKDLLEAILRELQSLDPRTVPFDSDEVQNLESGVAQAVKDFFGSGSPEYGEYEEFRIAGGHISRGDSRAEKQSKYEMELPRAIKRIEELLLTMERASAMAQEKEKTKPSQQSGSRTTVKPQPKAAVTGKPSAEATPETKPETVKKPSPATAKGETRAPSSKTETRQPGRILLLHEGGEDISSAVISLLEKVGIELALLEDSSTEIEGIASLRNIAFAIISVSPGTRGGLSGLTSVIGKPHSRHETVFKLGLLVGHLGPGKVLIVHSGDRLQDIPEQLFGVRYLPYKEDGGWQIGMLKLLKANGFYIDANLLFD